MESFSLASGETVSLSLVRRKWRGLDVAGYAIGYFLPQHEKGIRALPDFVQAERYAQLRPVSDLEIGCNELVRFVPATDGVGGA